MDYATQIQRGVDYIEANLDYDIELAKVSRIAGVSHWHFQRMFKATTGETLKTYVRSRRLAKSLDRLLTTKDSILDIAVLAGFESQEAFTRAFKRAFDLTPNAYRKLGDKSLFLKKVRFDVDYLRHININVSLQPEIDAHPELVVVGLPTHFYSVDSDKNNIGETLPQLWAEFLPRLGEVACAVGGTCYGVVQPAATDSAQLLYHAAIGVAGDVDPPPGMASVRVPAATYATFTHRGDPRGIDRTVNYIYSTWLAQSGHRHTYGPDLEIYGEQWQENSPDSVMHYAIPIRE